jgi:hypothetical protein
MTSTASVPITHPATRDPRTWRGADSEDALYAVPAAIICYARRRFEGSKNDTAFTSENLAPTFEASPKSDGHYRNFDRISCIASEL